MSIKKTLSISFTVIFLLAFLLTFTAKSTPVFAQESMTHQLLITQNSNPEISPQIIYSYPKTVIVTYTSYPTETTYYYKEFRNDLGVWFSGTLYLTSVIQSGSSWRATYTGTMVGNI